MSVAPGHSVAGFTRTALFVVIAVVVLLAVLLTLAVSDAEMKSRSLCCNCNLKQLGTAYRIWANDHNGLFPSEAPTNLGGCSNLLARPDAASFCWVNYAIMSNELGQSTVVLVCPADPRKPAADFSHFTNNLQTSYFAGLRVDDNWPEGLLGGDRNVCLGTNATDDFGFSPADGKGSNVTLLGPACWSQKMHSKHRDGGFGNILLGDGSAQQCTSEAFARNWVNVAQETAEARAGATAPVGIRLIFP